MLHTVEEASELLRNVSAQAWVWWFSGTLPFVVLMLHFWTDMSRSSRDVAEGRLLTSALLLALSYWWMKIAQSQFGDHLLRTLRDEDDPPPMPLRGKLRFITSQALIHCTAPWILVLALAALVPFGWAFAFYHNALILGPGHFRSGGRTRELVTLALRQANYRPGHNHMLIILMLIAALLIWANAFFGTLTIAVWLQAFSGEDNAITRNPFVLFGSGAVASMFSLCFVITGPLVKAIYALRCFHGLSRKNGEDILVAFRHAAAPMMVACLFGLLCIAPSAVAANSQSTATQQSPGAPPAAGPGIDPSALDHNIQEVLKRDSFQWRMPRNMTSTKTEHGWLAGFFKTIGDWTKSVGKGIGDWFEHGLKEWIKSWFKDNDKSKDRDADYSGAIAWAEMTRRGLILLLIALGVVLVILLVRQWRRLPPKPVAATAALPEVDLQSEEVVASALPENEWLRLAREKMEAGDYRLALRALFLATLAHLGERRLVRIARSKSNGDYVRELTMRARDRDELRSRFSDTVRLFDWAWYGWHDVTHELLDRVRDHHQHITADAVS